MKLTLSSGIAKISAGDTADSLMERTDEALYKPTRLAPNHIVAKAKPTMRDLMKP